MKRYSTLDEWLVDYELFKQNPNDKDLVISIATKMENSPKKLRSKITDYIESSAIEVNPLLVIKNMVKRNPRCFVLVKEKKDIWFDC